MAQAARVQGSKLKKSPYVAIWQLCDKNPFLGILFKKGLNV